MTLLMTVTVLIAYGCVSGVCACVGVCTSVAKPAVHNCVCVCVALGSESSVCVG